MRRLLALTMMAGLAAPLRAAAEVPTIDQKLNDQATAQAKPERPALEVPSFLRQLQERMQRMAQQQRSASSTPVAGTTPATPAGSVDPATHPFFRWWLDVFRLPRPSTPNAATTSPSATASK